MSCIAAIVNSPVLGSCRSPSLKVCTDSIDPSSEIHSGSPLRSPLNNSASQLLHSPLPLRQISLLKSSPPQENLGPGNNAHRLSPSRNCLQTSRLRPILSVKDENHQPIQWNDSSPGKHDAGLGSSLRFSQRGRNQRFPGRIKVKEEQSEGVLTEISGGNGEHNSFSAVSPPLKRKRPPKLHIPKSPREVQMVSLHEKIIKEEITGFEGDHYGFYCKKGKKEVMEDTHTVIPNILGDSKQAFFGVYDGHGGRRAAEFVAEKLGQNIVDSILQLGEGDANMENAVRAGYLATDKEFLEQGVSSGACCVTALIKDGYLVVANAGDCRAVLSRNGNAEALTCDHKAGRDDERERIENLGGYVDIHYGTWRVQGSLAVSRSIGDLHLKQWVSAEPETRKVPITWDCEFMILASDGLWEKVSNQEAVDIGRRFCVEEKLVSPCEAFEPGEAWNENTSPPPKARKISLGSVPKVMRFRGLNGGFGTMGCHGKDLKDNLQNPESQQMPLGGTMAACKKLAEHSAARGTPDDISVMIVDLRPFCREKN